MLRKIGFKQYSCVKYYYCRTFSSSNCERYSFFLPIFEPEISKTFCVLYISQRYSVEKSYTDNRVLCMIDRREILKRQISPMYMPLANTLAFLGRPLDRLVLGINPSGAIAKVVNQEEIAEQWRQLKQTDEAQALLTDLLIDLSRGISNKLLEGKLDDYKDILVKEQECRDKMSVKTK